MLEPLNNLNELIGAECTYTGWDEKNYNATVKGFTYSLETPFPGTIQIGVRLNLVNKSSFDYEDLDFIENDGVSIEDVSGLSI